MAEDVTGGGAASTAGTDMTETNAKLEEIVKALTGDEKKLIQDIAIQLYANSDFDRSGKSAQQIANAAIERAMILASKLPK